MGVAPRAPGGRTVGWVVSYGTAGFGHSAAAGPCAAAAQVAVASPAPPPTANAGLDIATMNTMTTANVRTKMVRLTSSHPPSLARATTLQDAQLRVNELNGALGPTALFT
jgi:hypothetical protein